MKMSNDINCIILCAGTGSRMNCDTKNKVCFEIAGKPAVVRVIENLQECGVRKFVVVVGSKAESVMTSVAHIEGVTFAFQKEQSGTGNAALCGLKVLNSFSADGPVLVVMGDKLISKKVFRDLINDFYSKDADISLITQPAEFNASGGKIVVSEDKVLGIVEHMDLLLLTVCERLASGESLDDIYSVLNLTEKQKSKLDKKLGDIRSVENEFSISLAGKKLSSKDITASNMVNCATYLYKRDAINSSIFNLKSDNAQNEIYFTDTVEKIAQSGKVSYVKIAEKSLIQTFNTPKELEEINNYFTEGFTNEF